MVLETVKVLAVLLALNGPARAELMIMYITPANNFRIADNTVSYGIMIGDSTDIVALGRSFVLKHSMCENLLLPPGSGPPSASSILKPMVPYDGPPPPSGVVLIQTADIVVKLAAPEELDGWKKPDEPKNDPWFLYRSRAALAEKERTKNWILDTVKRLAIAGGSGPPETATKPYDPRNPWMSIGGPTCTADEACALAGGHLKGSVECEGVKLGISTSGSIDIGGGPVTVTIGQPK